MISVFLYYYYGCFVDPTMLIALSAIASAQAKPTEDTMTCCRQFLDYTATHQGTTITYRKIDVVIVVHSDASYLSEPKARSHVGKYFFMSSDVDDPINKRAILNLAQLIKAIMFFTEEAKLGALYINSCEAVPQCQTFEEMGHKQLPTPMQTDNTTALGGVNSNSQPRCPKAMNMQFHWLRWHKTQDQV